MPMQPDLSAQELFDTGAYDPAARSIDVARWLNSAADDHAHNHDHGHEPGTATITMGMTMATRIRTT
jgi:hypothetical protein